jgi:hypothetical protein
MLQLSFGAENQHTWIAQLNGRTAFIKIVKITEKKIA